MKILHIIDSGGLYGAEVMLLNLVDEQIKIGLDPTICSIGDPRINEKPLEKEAISRGLKIKKFRMRPGPNILGAMEILKFAHCNHFDVMHSHCYKGNILFGFIPKKVRKIPLVSTIHGWTNMGGFNRMKLYEWLDRKTLKFIDSIVVVNRVMLLNPVFSKHNFKNVSVINNGIPRRNFKNSNLTYDNKSSDSINENIVDEEIARFCKDGFIVGAIGRLSKEKGFDYLIEAVKLLINKGLNLKLVIIGEGNERDYLQEKSKSLNLKDKVALPGYRSNGWKYLPLFDVFVISSLTEGLPITLLEAMQAKTPIVATRVGGIPDVLKQDQGGLLVEPKNPKSLVEAIFKIYEAPRLAEKLTSFSYNEVNLHYTSNAMALRYLDIYKSTRFLQKPWLS